MASKVECGCIVDLQMFYGCELKLFKAVDGRLHIEILDNYQEDSFSIRDRLVEREAKNLRDSLLELYPLED